MFLLVILFACDDTTMSPTFNAEEISPYQKYQDIENDIRQVLDDWEADNKHQAREKLLTIYQGPFQEFHPLLAQNDRLGLVQLEWTFGQTFQKMKALQRKGRKEQGEQLIQKLQEEMLALPNVVVPTEVPEEGNSE